MDGKNDLSEEKITNEEVHPIAEENSRINQLLTPYSTAICSSVADMYSVLDRKSLNPLSGMHRAKVR